MALDIHGLLKQYPSQSSGAYQPETPQAETLGENFGAGVSSGIDNTQGMFYGLGAMAGESFGDKDLYDWGVAGATRNEEEAASNAPRVQSISQIGSAKDFFHWGAGVMGELAPSLFVTAITGGAGAVAGGAGILSTGGKAVAQRLIANKLENEVVKKSVASMVAKGVSEKAAQESVVKAMGQKWGAIAGAYVGSDMLNTGDLYNELRNAGVKDAPQYALGGGAIASLLDVVPEAMAFNEILGKSVEGKLKESFGRGLLKKVAKYGGIEGAAEGGQEAISLGTHALADPTFDPTSHESMMRVADSWAAGTIAGVLGGGGVKAIDMLKGKPKAPAAAPAAPTGVDTTAAAPDHLDEILGTPPGPPQDAAAATPPAGDTQAAPDTTAPPIGQQDAAADLDGRFDGRFADHSASLDALAGQGAAAAPNVTTRNWTSPQERFDAESAAARAGQLDPRSIARAPTAQEMAETDAGMGTAADAEAEAAMGQDTTGAEDTASMRSFSDEPTRILGAHDTEHSSVDEASRHGWAAHPDGTESDSVIKRRDELRTLNPDAHYETVPVQDETGATRHVITEHSSPASSLNMVFDRETRRLSPMVVALSKTIANARNAARNMSWVKKEDIQKHKDYSDRVRMGNATESEKDWLEEHNQERRIRGAMNEKFAIVDMETGEVLQKDVTLNLHRLTALGMRLDEDKSGTHEERVRRGFDRVISEMYGTPVDVNVHKNASSSYVRGEEGTKKTTRRVQAHLIPQNMLASNEANFTGGSIADQFQGKIFYESNTSRGKGRAIVSTKGSFKYNESTGKWDGVSRERDGTNFSRGIESSTVEAVEPRQVQLVADGREGKQTSKSGHVYGRVTHEIKSKAGRLIGFVRDDGEGARAHQSEVYLLHAGSGEFAPHPEYAYNERTSKLEKTEHSPVETLGRIETDAGTIRRVKEGAGEETRDARPGAHVLHDSYGANPTPITHGPASARSAQNTIDGINGISQEFAGAQVGAEGSVAAKERQNLSRSTDRAVFGGPKLATEEAPNAGNDPSLAGSETDDEQAAKMSRAANNAATISSKDLGAYAPNQNHPAGVEPFALNGETISERTHKLARILQEMMDLMGAKVPIQLLNVTTKNVAALTHEYTKKALQIRYGMVYGEAVYDEIVKAHEQKQTAFAIKVPGHGWVVHIDPSLHGRVAIEQLLHEAGHVIIEDAYDSAPASTQAELTAAWQEDLTAGRSTAKDGFYEWQAHQFVAWASRNTAATTIVEKWFASIAEKLKELWNTLRGKYHLNTTFEQFVKGVQESRTRDQYNKPAGMMMRSLGRAALDSWEGLPFEFVEKEPTPVAPRDTESGTPVLGEGATPKPLSSTMRTQQNLSPQASARLGAISRRNFTTPRDVGHSLASKLKPYLRKFALLQATGEGFRNLAMHIHDTIFASMGGIMGRMRDKNGNVIPMLDWMRRAFHPNAGEQGALGALGYHSLVEKAQKDLAGKLDRTWHDIETATMVNGKKDPAAARKLQDAVVAEMRKHDFAPKGTPGTGYDPALAKYCGPLHSALEAAHDFAVKSGLPIQHVENFFPRVYDKMKLIAERQAAVQSILHLVKSSVEAEAIIDSIVNDEHIVPLPEDGTNVAATAFGNIKHRVLDDKIAQALAPFMSTDLYTITHTYANQLGRRATFNEHWGQDIRGHKVVWQRWKKDTEHQIHQWRTQNDPRGFLQGSDNSVPYSNDLLAALKDAGLEQPQYNPTQKITEKLDKIKEKLSKEDQDSLNDLVARYFGRVGLMSTPLKRAMSQIMAYQNMRLLAFTVLGAFPDLATPMIRGNGVTKTLGSYLKQMNDVDRKAAVQSIMQHWHLAVETLDQHVMSDNAFGDPSTARAGAITEKFFKYTGVKLWENFSRSLTISTGIDYLLEAAAKGQTDKLTELSLTAQDVQAWNAAGQPPEGKVGAALVRFMHEGKVSNVALANKTKWGADPRFMLIWHLKGYTYEFQNRVMGRIWHDLNKSNVTSEQLKFLPAAVLAMGLMGLGLELRELLQYGIFGDSEDAPTDKMGGAQYLFTLLSRAGFTGMGGQYVTDAVQAGQNGRSPLLSLTGPTVTQVSDVFQRSLGANLSGAIPGLNNVTTPRNALKHAIDGSSPAGQ